ncbi:hypothetical protein Q5692_35190 [Microcoleus sp. C2C3]
MPVWFVEQARCLFSLWNRHLACLVCGTGKMPVWFVEQASCLFSLWNRHLACFSIKSRSPRKGKL